MRVKETSPTDTLRADLVISAVGLEFGVVPFTAPVRKGCKQGRGSPHMIMAGQICLYLLHTVFHLNLSRVGRAFDRHATTAHHACRVIEASREDPVLDARLRKLEDFLRRAPVPHDSRVFP